MIPMPAGTRIWVACGATDMRRGFDGLAMMVQDVLKKSPYCGHLFVFRGKRADRLKILWWDGTGLCLYAKRLHNCRCCARELIGARRSAPTRREKYQHVPADRMIV